MRCFHIFYEAMCQYDIIEKWATLKYHIVKHISSCTASSWSTRKYLFYQLTNKFELGIGYYLLQGFLRKYIINYYLSWYCMKQVGLWSLTFTFKICYYECMQYWIYQNQLMIGKFILQWKHTIVFPFLFFSNVSFNLLSNFSINLC